MPTEETKTHLAKFLGALYADSHVLQHANDVGGVTDHLGWGDFTLTLDDTVVQFSRCGGSTSDEAMTNRGWRYHGRPHVLAVVHQGAHTLEDVFAKLESTFGKAWVES